MQRNCLYGGGGGAEGDGGGSGGRGNIDVSVWLGYISYSLVQIRISYLYRHYDIEWPAHFKAGISSYYKVLKRKGRSLVQYIGLEITEGKKPITLQVYTYLAKRFF